MALKTAAVYGGAQRRHLRCRPGGCTVSPSLGGHRYCNPCTRTRTEHDEVNQVTHDKMEPKARKDRTAYVAVALFLMTASFVLIKTGRDALYFQRDGLFDLPAAYLGIALMAAPTAAFVLLLMRKWGPRATRVAAPAVMALAFAGLSFAVHPGGGPFMTGFFMLVPLAFGVLFSLSWLLAADLLEGVPTAQLGSSYGAIGAAAIAGGFVGGMSARTMAGLLTANTMLLAGAVLLLTSAAAMGAAHRRYRPQMAPPSADGSEIKMLRGFAETFSQPYVLLLLTMAVAGSIAGILVEFHFYLAAATSGNSGPENTVFFANLYTVLNAAALVVQLAVVPALQRRIGTVGSLLLLPMALVGGAAMLLASSALLLRSGLRAAEGGIKSSIYRSNWEQAFAPIAHRTRGFAKLVIDGFGVRMGEGMAAVAILFWLSGATRGELAGRSAAPMTVLLLVAAVVWLMLGWGLRSQDAAHDTTAGEPSITALPVPDS